MGIDLCKRNGHTHVSFNNNHERRIDTSIQESITWKNTKGMQSCSLLIRHRSNDKIDGNPFIYALKKLNDCKIDRISLLTISKNAEENLNTAISGKDYDLIIIIPSSSKIGHIIAKRIKNKISNAIIGAKIFRKNFNHEIIQQIESQEIKEKDHKQISILLSSLHKAKKHQFALKKVPRGIREYCNPLSVKDNKLITEYNNILLVDDTVSSGTTLYNAKQIIHSFNPNASIEVISLLGTIH
ncbi:MAG: hypothetical protein DRG78_01215 [Epsilonproteobacteria bacterium]|nr:MAG: hypothetical protein DRG78_01215 [Campylobacterota bacterium]